MVRVGTLVLFLTLGEMLSFFFTIEDNVCCGFIIYGFYYVEVNYVAKFRLKLKKVGKTTRPFMYDLNQIPYDYTVEVRIYLRD